ncbi:MAG: AAA family ATPase [Chloroflexi bacterium]|nr:AAA family ATPase [Chloroflexota bacterium]
MPRSKISGTSNDLASRFRVDWDKTTWKRDLEAFAFKCTDELTPLDYFIGQDRAQEAIRFGLEVDKPGYNLFVTGLTGTGKTSAIKTHLQSIVDDLDRQGKRRPISDWTYVYNFEDPDRPRVIRLPRGSGKAFRQQLATALRTLQEEIPKMLKSEGFEAQVRGHEETERKATQDLMSGLEQAGQEANFAVQLTPNGITIFPMTEGRPMTPEEYQALESEPKQAIDEVRSRLMQDTQDTMAKIRELEKSSAQWLQELERSAGDQLVDQVFFELHALAQEIPEMRQFLSDLGEYVLGNINLFKETDGPRPAIPGMAGAPGMPGIPPGPAAGSAALGMNPFLPFELNVLVDNSAVDKLPIIIEPNPNWGNLFGRIERRAMMGTYVSDHGMLKPGAVHLANGGYLVLNARDVLMAPGAWEGLKRSIRNQEARLEDPAEQTGLFIPQGLRPEPVPLDLKVIVTGDESIYRLLTSSDNEDFWDLFKVKAEFDYRVDLNEENVMAYCAFICRTCEEENLLAFETGGAAKVLEFGARQVSDQTKLSTRFGQIKDLLIEADYWARKDDAPLVQDHHVQQAVNQKIYRLNLVEERLQEMISDGSLLLDVTGEKVGQINGLAVYDLGDFSFGRPTRITVQTFAGREGFINIEREASMSGRTHDKGVLILSGYLGAKFGRDRPLTLSASICFEQSYDGVDGDSASSTELYAIASSLSGLPLRQDIAVTGSVNQKGEIQPIGGVNQKVEGMFDVCRAASGLTGTQGVVIPHQNVKNLMLRDDVVEAIRDGKFHVYAVKTIDEGLEILTGTAAGEADAAGEFPEGTVNYLIAKRLGELNDSMRGYFQGLLSNGS